VMSCMMNPSCMLSQIHAPPLFRLVYSLYTVLKCMRPLLLFYQSKRHISITSSV